MCLLPVSSAILLSVCSSLITVGFDPSEQLLDRDFSFRCNGGEGGRRKSEEGAKRYGIERVVIKRGGRRQGRRVVVFIL